MKLSSRTMLILKNFARVVEDKGLGIEVGNRQSALSKSRKVIGRATVVEEFPVKFAVAAAGKFVGALGLFTAPELDFTEVAVKISDEKSTVTYNYSDPETPTSVVNDSFWSKIPAGDIPFKLTKQVLGDVLKAGGTLELPEITVSGRGGKIFVEATDSKKPLSHAFSAEVGETDKTFRINFTSLNWAQMISQDYDAAVIGAKRIVHFNGGDIEYWLSGEENSEAAS